MPAIQHWDGEKIDQGKVHGKQRGEGDEGRKPHIGDLPRHLRNPQRPTQILGAAAARNHLPNANQGLPGDIQRMGHPRPNSAEGVKLFENRHAGGDAQHAKPIRWPRLRGRHDLDLGIAPRDQDFNGLAGTRLDIALQCLKPLNLLAIHGDNAVPWREPGTGSGRGFHHIAHTRHGGRPANHHKKRSK